MLNIQENVDLHPLSTFRVGGKARYLVEATSEHDVAEALTLAKERSLRVFVLGGGSNVLFADRGWDGLILKMENVSITSDESGRIHADAGATLHGVVEYAKNHGFSGMERLAGIPGTLGGAVRGNAGAFGAETAASVFSVRALNREIFEVRDFPKSDCDFGYRMSFFKAHPDRIILSAELSLTPGANPDELGRIMHETIMTREMKHPQRLLCAGSFFMNPVVTDEALRREFELDTGTPAKDEKLPAGWLIDHVGLRGKEIGGAKVSDIHPNYLVNTGNATAESVLILASVIKQRVRTELGIRLREEVQMVGF